MEAVAPQPKTFDSQESHAPLGPDGNPIKTSVCDEIQESVEKAAKMETQMANMKVAFKSIYFVV